MEAQYNQLPNLTLGSVVALRNRSGRGAAWLKR